MQIGVGQTETTVSFYPRSTNAQGRYNALNVVVPEPATATLSLLALAALAARRRGK